jgi:hypothetical protein
MKKNKIQKTRTVGGHEDSKGLTGSDAADSDATSKNSELVTEAPREAGGKEWVKRLEPDTISIIKPQYVSTRAHFSFLFALCILRSVLMSLDYFLFCFLLLCCLCSILLPDSLCFFHFVLFCLFLFAC